MLNSLRKLKVKNIPFYLFWLLEKILPGPYVPPAKEAWIPIDPFESLSEKTREDKIEEILTRLSWQVYPSYKTFNTKASDTEKARIFLSLLQDQELDLTLRRFTHTCADIAGEWTSSSQSYSRRIEPASKLKSEELHSDTGVGALAAAPVALIGAFASLFSSRR